jgi:hypothetical protein
VPAQSPASLATDCRSLRGDRISRNDGATAAPDTGGYRSLPGPPAGQVWKHITQPAAHGARCGGPQRSSRQRAPAVRGARRPRMQGRRRAPSRWAEPPRRPHAVTCPAPVCAGTAAVRGLCLRSTIITGEKRERERGEGEREEGEEEGEGEKGAGCECGGGGVGIVVSVWGRELENDARKRKTGNRKRKTGNRGKCHPWSLR